LARTRLRLRHLQQFHHFWFATLFDTNRFHIFNTLSRSRFPNSNYPLCAPRTPSFPDLEDKHCNSLEDALPSEHGSSSSGCHGSTQTNHAGLRWASGIRNFSSSATGPWTSSRFRSAIFNASAKSSPTFSRWTRSASAPA